jgi:HAD superfamily hydrolase (TIGR01490 family)
MPGAVFSDVEGTLMSGSLPRMCLTTGREAGLISRSRVARIWALAIGAQALPGERRREIQIATVVRAIAGCSEAEVAWLMEAVMPAALQRLKSRMLQRLREHQEAGMPLVLLSAGMHPAIARLGGELGGRGEGTKLVVRDGRYTAELDGPVCQGKGKAERARAVLAALGCDPAASHAYGDSASDIPYLSLFGHPCAVDPDAALAAAAHRRGWPILRSGE